MEKSEVKVTMQETKSSLRTALIPTKDDGRVDGKRIAERIGCFALGGLTLLGGSMLGVWLKDRKSGTTTVIHNDGGSNQEN